MKAKILLILIFSIPAIVSCQINSSIDFITGLEYSYRNLNTSSKEGIVVEIMERRDDKETGKFNWRIGFNYNKRLAKQLFLKTGIRLASVGYKGEKITGLRYGSEHDGMGGWTPDPSLPHEIQFIYNYWFAEIPVVGRLEFPKNKITPFVELGFSPSIYLTTRTKSITDIGTDVNFQDRESQNFNNFQVVGVISFGANYSINEKLQIFGQPTFRYHLTKLVDAPIGEHLLNYGLELGIRRKIN